MKLPLTVALLTLSAAASIAWTRPAQLTERYGAARSEPVARAEEPPFTWVDVDGDLRPEVFTVRPDGRPALLRHAGAGALEDASEAYGLDRLPAVARALWQDADGDALPDLLVVARDGDVRVLRNDGAQGLRDVTATSGLDALAAIAEAAWRDVDGDGRPDLVLATAEGVALARNLGGFAFEVAVAEVAGAAGSIPFAPPVATAGPRPADAGTAPSSSERADAARASESRRHFVRGVAGPAPQPLTSAELPPSAAPFVASAACAKRLVDQTTLACIEAASKPALGKLYPISTELYVDAGTGNVGIHTTSPAARLDVDSGGGLGLSVGSTLAGGIPVRLYSANTSALTPTLMSTVGDGGVAGFFQESLAVGSLFTGLPAIKGTLGIDARDNAELRLQLADGTESVELLASEADGNGAQLDLRTAFGQSTITLDAQAGSSAAEVSMFDIEGNETVQVRSESSVTGSGGQLALRKDDGTNTIVMEAASNTGSEISMRNAAGLETIELLSEEVSGNGAQLRMSRGNGFPTFVLDAEQGFSSQFSMYNDNAIEAVEIVAQEGATDGAQIVLKKYDGTPSIILDASQGTDGRITTETLEITGGADLVEAFEALEACEPGSVVALDEDRPGALALATRPYDARVVGVVSGAGDVRPGLQLGQRDVLDGDTLVALSGRVYVRCCDENGPVRPGDLLTSSSTPGHAMRASDPARAFGAVIGKALEPLEGERGLVLVLVGLQ